MTQVTDIIEKSIATKHLLLKDHVLLSQIEEAASLMVKALTNDKKVLWCGNGGSAADAQHLAAELSGRFYTDRPPLYSEALHVNTSYITAVANDYSYDIVYSRMVQGCGRAGDILVGISTSGNSKNIVHALAQAKKMGITTISFTGDTGGSMKALTDVLINVPSVDTPRIQECHILIGHIICELVEQRIFKV